MNHWFGQDKWTTTLLIALLCLTVLFVFVVQFEEDVEEEQKTSHEEQDVITPFAEEDFFVDDLEDREGLSFDEDYEEYQQWLLKWRKGYPRPEEDGFQILSADQGRQLLLIELHEHVDHEQWYEEWNDRRDIEFIEPNRQMKINTQSVTSSEQNSGGVQTGERLQSSSDSELGQATFLQQIEADGEWEMDEGGEDITIAVLDTGVDTEHPALRDHLLPGTSMIEQDYIQRDVQMAEEDETVQDLVGHGTWVTGVIASTWEDHPHLRGVLSRANIMPVKVLYQYYDQEHERYDHDGDAYFTYQGINYAVDEGADIILLSIGHWTYSQTLQEAVEYAEEQGVLVIAAVGNDTDRDILYPAAYPTVLGVGAVNADDEPADYTNYGPEVGVVAPGGVTTTHLNGEWIDRKGTSFAAPQVAGLAALIWQKYPDLSPAQVRNHIKYTCDEVSGEGWNEYTGHGRINVQRALTTDPAADIYEENETKEEAAPLPIESVLHAELEDRDDRDWYLLEAPYRGTVQLDIELGVGKYEGVNLTYYPRGEEQDAETFTIQKSKQIELYVEEASVIEITFHDQERRTTPLPYRIINTFTIYDDDQHPNDSPENAFRLDGDGQWYTGTLNEDDAQDWYVFEAPGPGVLEMVVRAPSLRLDPYMNMERENYAGDLDFLSHFDFEVEHEVFTYEVEEGKYFFQIRDYHRNKANEEYYMSLVFYPEEV